jgi:hypothetical protein
LFQTKHKNPDDGNVNVETCRVNSQPKYVYLRVHDNNNNNNNNNNNGRLCGLMVRVLGYRSGGPGSIPGTTRKKNVVGLERGPLSLVSTN